MADETGPREFPPVRAGGSKRGQPAHIVIRGRNGRRTLLGVLDVATGEVVRLVRERGRAADRLALVAALGANRCSPSREALAARAVDWLDDRSATERHRRCGLQTSKFDWLLT